MCDPWEAKEFLDHADKIPDGTCDHCLPDCTATIYGATVSSAPFKPCDHTNLETSDLCQITAGNQTNPPLWAHKVQTQYKKVLESIPKYADNSSFFTDQRYRAQLAKIPNLVFQKDLEDNPTYNAYEEDITVVNFYFDKSSVLQFTRQESMTEIGFISQLGGLLGLFLGFSFVSAIELIYWLTIRLGRNVMNSKASEPCHGKKVTEGMMYTRSKFHRMFSGNETKVDKEPEAPSYEPPFDEKVE